MIANVYKNNDYKLILRVVHFKTLFFESNIFLVFDGLFRVNHIFEKHVKIYFKASFTIKIDLQVL